MILVIDNYDSFTYNLVQYIGALGHTPLVFRNDKIALNEISEINPEKIIISPGPGNPDSAGICIDLIKNFSHIKPILGVCLGHQSIGAAYGSIIDKASYLMHGKVSSIYHNQKGIFKNLPNPIFATRYHSLVISKHNLSPDLEITAWTEDNLIMGCRHKLYPNVYGVQFHPESILTEYGHQILQNFLDLDLTS